MKRSSFTSHNPTHFNNLFHTNVIDNSFDTFSGSGSNNQHDCLYTDEESLLSSISNKISDFSVCNINARSLLKNYDDICNLISDSLHSNFSVVAVTETWINFNSPVNMLHIPNYTFIHVDGEGKRGGGVAFYIHNSIQYKKRTDLTSITSNYESLFIEVTQPGCKIVVGGVYTDPPTVL